MRFPGTLRCRTMQKHSQTHIMVKLYLAILLFIIKTFDHFTLLLQLEKKAKISFN